MTVAVGQDIESLCNKCGDVWHVVVAKVGEKIAKVQCKQCGAYHRHRPPGGTASKSAKKTRTSTGRARKSSSSNGQAAARIDKPLVEPDLSRPIKPYRFNDTFEVGDRIEHAKFGTGVVELVPEPGKMQVFFADGRRILALAKPRPTLERPQPFRYRE